MDIKMNVNNELDISAAARTINESIDQPTPSCLKANHLMHDESIEEYSKLPKLDNLNLSALEEEKYASKQSKNDQANNPIDSQLLIGSAASHRLSI